MALQRAVGLGQTTRSRKYARGQGTTTTSSSRSAASQTTAKTLQTSNLASKTISGPTETPTSSAHNHFGKHNHHDHNFDAASPDSTSSSGSATPTDNSKSNSSNGNSNSGNNGSDKGNNSDQDHGNGNGDNKNGGGDDSDSDGDDDDNNNGNNGNNSGGGGFPKFPGPKNFGPCEVVNENDGRLRYTGTWILESKDPNGIVATTHTTSTAGSAVTISFNGTSITIIGIVHASNDTVPPAVASYTIDDDTPVSLPLPFSNRDIPNQQFFESPTLELSTHKLTINITSDNSPYTLDTLFICSQGNGAVATVLTPSTTPKASHKSTTTIIGAAVAGGVAFILFIVLGVVLLHRIRRRNMSRRTASSPIKSWLQHTIFTSSESIMRNNPSNISSLDPYEKLPDAEKARPASAAASQASASSLYRDSKLLPPAPGLRLSDRAPRTPPTPSLRSVMFASKPDLSSPSLLVLDKPEPPAPGLRSVSLPDKELPLSALPEVYRALPPHPPLYTQRPTPF